VPPACTICGSWEQRPFSWGNISVHLCEHLASKVQHFKGLQGHFCVSCDFLIFGQTCVCIFYPHSHPLNLTSPSDTHPSNNTRSHTRTYTLTHTHTHTHTYTHVDIICDAQLKLHACPVPTVGRWPGEEELISAPGPPPWSFALAPGAGRQMPCRPPVWRVTVAKVYSI